MRFLLRETLEKAGPSEDLLHVSSAALNKAAAVAIAGPFIGPRGGKWADPQHTIPWQPTKPRRRAAEKREAPTKRPWIEHLEGMPNQTIDVYRNPDKTYKRERLPVHKRIVDGALKGKKPPPAGTVKIAIVMMGGTASGKSSLVNSILQDRKSGYVNVDPDDVKAQLPEWKPGLEASAKDTAKVLHEESSDVASSIYNRAIDKGLNMIVDGTGKDAEKHIEKVKRLQAEGYKVTILMPDLDVGEAIKRSGDRAERSGRFVPEEFIHEAYRKIPGNFERIARVADSFGLFDSREPQPVLKWSGGKGEPDSVHDPRFVVKFRSRAERVARPKNRVAHPAMAKAFYIMTELKKAKEPEGRPYATVLELAEVIRKTPLEVSQPDRNKPKTFDRHVGVEFTFDDIDLE